MSINGSLQFVEQAYLFTWNGPGTHTHTHTQGTLQTTSELPALNKVSASST